MRRFLLLIVVLPWAVADLPSPHWEAWVLVGTVSDSAGPIPGATVRLAGTAFAVTTDAAGQFRLPVPPPPWRPVTAFHPGYLIAGADATDRPLRFLLHRLPVNDCDRYEWVDPFPGPGQRGACLTCHPTIGNEWAHSAHARSATGAAFRAFYADAARHQPDGIGVCAACHAPTAPTIAFDLRAPSALPGVSRHGVHCDYCHKITAVEGELGLTHGRDALRLLRPDPQSDLKQLFFGPLDDVARQEDSMLPLYRQSRYCAACHEGVVFGVPVYTTYSEWQASPAARAGRQCQDCHMAPTGRMSNVAPQRGGLERDPLTLSNHVFFAESRQAMLRRSIRLTVKCERLAQRVRVSVTVRADHVGHRVPTGFVDRQVLLSLEAVDAVGQPVPLLEGTRLPPWTGQLHGQPGRAFAKVVSNGSLDRPTPFWHEGVEVVADTRLRPGQPESSVFAFPTRTEQVRVRLVWRRFRLSDSRRHGLDNEEIVIQSGQYSVPTKEGEAVSHGPSGVISRLQN